MNDSPRNNFDFNHQMELLPQLNVNENQNFVAILISHNFYSTDSKYGIKLLKNYIHALTLESDKEIILMLSDKGVLLLNDDELLNDFIILSEVNSISVSLTALEEYRVEPPESISCSTITDNEFISLLLELNPIILA